MEQPVMLAASRFDVAASSSYPWLRARVERTYRAAAYVRADGADVVVLSAGITGCQPNGITVAGSRDLRERCPVGAEVVVDLGRGMAWSPRLPSGIDAGSSAFSAGALRARATAGELAPDVGFGGLLTGREPRDMFTSVAAPHIVGLESALAEGDAVGAAGSAIRLLGLGVGLTPSGDDLLIGLLAALHVRRHAVLPLVAMAIATAATTSTTGLSAAGVVAAAHGRFPQRLHDVLIAIDANDDEAIRLGIERATQFGASSGADTLVGLFVGLGQTIANRVGRVTTAA